MKHIVRLLRTDKSVSVFASIAIVVAVPFMTSGCNRSAHDWEIAKQENTTSSYKAFLQKYPNTEHSDEARNALEQLDWMAVEKAGTSETLNAFVAKYPNGRQYREAIQRIDWDEAKTYGNTEAFSAFLKKHPDSTHTSEVVEFLDWHAAVQSDTVEALSTFLQKHRTQAHADEARKELESIRYKPTRGTIEQVIRKTVREGGTFVGPVADSWTIKVRIDSVGEYDKQEKYLRVDAVAILTDGKNQYAVAPKYVRLTTDEQGNWKAEFIGSKL